MKILVALTFMLGIFVAPAYAQKGGVSFNGNIFDAPPEPGAGYTQSPPAKAKASRHVTRHVKRHISHKHSAS